MHVLQKPKCSFALSPLSTLSGTHKPAAEQRALRIESPLKRRLPPRSPRAPEAPRSSGPPGRPQSTTALWAAGCLDSRLSPRRVTHQKGNLIGTRPKTPGLSGQNTKDTRRVTGTSRAFASERIGLATVWGLPALGTLVSELAYNKARIVASQDCEQISTSRTPVAKRTSERDCFTLVPRIP